MAELRLDVRKMLLKRGWQEPKGWGRTMEKGRAVWATTNASGDSSLTAYRDGHSEFTLGFSSEVPARVIVAACEEAQKPLRSDRQPQPQEER
jgi:hypothetical protein